VNGPLTMLGTNTMQIGKNGTNALCDSVAGLGTVLCGGTLNITLTSGTLMAGDTFKLFQAETYSGAFGALNFPALDQGLYWDTAALASAGLLKVSGITPPIVQPPAILWDGTVMLSLSGAPGLSYDIWATADLSHTPISWDWLGSAQFDASGVATYYDPYAPFYLQRFYVISVP